MTERSSRRRRATGTFEELADAVAPKELIDAIDTSKRLSVFGVPHALFLEHPTVS